MKRKKNLTLIFNSIEEEHLGKDVFFLSGTGKISLKREGEDSSIVTCLGEGSKVYSTMRLQNDWIVFMEDGSYVFNLKTHQDRKSVV